MAVSADFEFFSAVPAVVSARPAVAAPALLGQRRYGFSMSSSTVLALVAAVAFGGGLFLAALPSSPYRGLITGGLARAAEVLYLPPSPLVPTSDPLNADGSARAISAAVHPSGAPALAAHHSDPQLQGSAAARQNAAQATSGTPNASTNHESSSVAGLDGFGPPSMYAFVRAAQLSGALPSSSEPLESGFAALEVAMVPEPSMTFLIAAGLALLVATNQTRRPLARVRVRINGR